MAQTREAEGGEQGPKWNRGKFNEEKARALVQPSPLEAVAEVGLH